MCRIVMREIADIRQTGSRSYGTVDSGSHLYQSNHHHCPHHCHRRRHHQLPNLCDDVTTASFVALQMMTANVGRPALVGCHKTNTTTDSHCLLHPTSYKFAVTSQNTITQSLPMQLSIKKDDLNKQVSHLSHRDHAMICVIEYFIKSLK